MQLPDFSVKDRVALVTGAGRGIGLAIAKALAASGARVAIHDIELDIAQQEADAIHRAGGQAIALGGDATDPALAEALVEQVVSKLGALHILVNNVAIQRGDEFANHSADEMTRQLTCNVVFTTRLCQLATPHMEQANWGRIINIGSVQGKQGNSHMPAYAMSKAALENLTRGLARGYAKMGITVNCIGPGYFNTYRNRDEFKSAQDVQDRGKHVPLGRVGRPEDCVGLAVLLCSPAGEYITGQVIYVDGGITSR